MKNKKFYIATPIYYASGNLHIGHVYTTTLARVIANYKKLDGYEVKMLTGSDEHGQKIEQKAKEANLDPQVFVDQLVQKYLDLWKLYDIKFDYYQRTTNQSHKTAIQHIFSKFLQDGYIYKGKYEGLYSVSDEEFLTETQAVFKDGKYYHPQSNHELILVSEESYFFKMNQFAEWLIDYINQHPSFLAPQKLINEMMNNFLLKGLEDLSVTRTNINWGIKTLEDPNHTVYVWLDALCNYISALGYDPNKAVLADDFNAFWNDENAEVVHLIGKEIARFHMIYWPIFLKALDLRLPTRIQSHGWIVTPTGKMSKSKGNVVDPVLLLEKYHPEMVKYYLSSQIILGEDGVYDEDRLIDLVNADLINNFGNLVSRTLKMKSNTFETTAYKVSDYALDQEIDQKIIQSVEAYKSHFDRFEVDKALKIAINLSSELNKYIDETQPWTLKEDLERLELIIARLLNGIYAVATYLSVVLEQKMQEVLQALNIEAFSFNLISNFGKFDNIKQANQFMLFQRIKK
ncbi:methionine--tRNA ligase [Mycoplasma corogypsi]|uniref:methionine--tRNA ligase n=1 Tax=Mycoplasma corogypsi TaxID=2106 RepID=UPI0038732879